MRDQHSFLNYSQVVCPGDTILKLPESGVVRIGGGLLQVGDSLIASKAGILLKENNSKYWIQNRQNRYIPASGEEVIGIIIEKYAEHLVVDIQGPSKAILPVLSFENATRRNRPNLNPGDVVFARVAVADRDIDPELSCIHPSGKENIYGPLKEGLLIQCSSSQARAIQESQAQHPALSVLLKHGHQFELAVGINGRVWVSAGDPRTAILVAMALQETDNVAPEDAKSATLKLLKGQGL